MVIFPGEKKKDCGPTYSPHFQLPSFPCNYIVLALRSCFIQPSLCRVPEKEDCLKEFLRAFHNQPFSQDTTHSPISLPAVSVLLISLGNPGQLVISNSFIC